jgi:hypothetical protein
LSRHRQKINESAYYPPGLPWQPQKDPGITISTNEAKEKLSAALASRGILKDQNDRMKL